MGQYETANQIWNYLLGQGWSKTAVAALLGNMQSESEIIADRWQSDIIGNMSGGYGLVQWTPATKYIDWAQANGLEYTDVISQCKRIEWEVANNQQFSCPFMTFQQFKTSSQSPEELAEIFIKYYERPADPNQPIRAQQARYWYNQFNIKVIDWFVRNRNHLTYSMYGSRNGTDGTADCSGSITQAVYEATGIAYDYLYSTVTLGSYLAKCGYTRVLIGNVSGSNLNQIQDEDIILLSAGYSMADSGGAGGHTGVISGGGKYITSTCYYTEGAANTAIQDLSIDANYLAVSGFNYYEVWRRAGGAYSTTTPSIPSTAEPTFSTDVYYGLRVLDGSWLDETKNFNNADSNGFAGLPNHQHDLLYIRVAHGTLRYRVHTVQSGWLDWVSKGDKNDTVYGCAGMPGEAIDGVQIYYTTPSGEPFSQSYYRSQTTARSGWLNTCCDDGTSIAIYDGWAGIFGEPLDRLQIGISTANPFLSQSYTPVNPNGSSLSTNVHYSLRLLNGAWLGEITNFNDVDATGFAGMPNNQHDLLYIKVDHGTLRYRVHTSQSGWLGWVSKGDPTDTVNGCAGMPGEAIDGVQIYYTTPSGESFSQSYYRSQTTARSGWLNVCCDDGTSIAAFDAWAGMYGEPLDRLQIGIAKANPFFSYSTINTGNAELTPDQLPASTETNTERIPKEELNTLVNRSVNEIIQSVPALSPLLSTDITFESSQTYGPIQALGIDFWITTSEAFTQMSDKKMMFSIKNGKLTSDFAGTMKDIYHGFVGPLDYVDAANAINGIAEKLQNGTIVFSAAHRPEEPNVLGTKITFQYETTKGKAKAKTEVSFEIYFKNNIISPAYPTETYEQLYETRNDYRTYVALGLCALIVAGGAIAIFSVAGPFALGALALA